MEEKKVAEKNVTAVEMLNKSVCGLVKSAERLIDMIPVEKTMIITIPEDVVNNIQALQYEVESRKDLIAFMLDKGCDVHGDSFQMYHKEHQEFFDRYNRSKDDMQKRFLEPQINGRLLRWNLDFATREVICTYEEK